MIITGFSAQTAVRSANESTGVLEKILTFFFNTDIDTIDKKTFGMLHSFIRKLAHFTNFFILGFIHSMLANEYCSERKVRICVTVWLCGLAGAILDECHQYFVPGRGTELGDVCIDFFGVIAGWVLLTILKKVFKC